MNKFLNLRNLFVFGMLLFLSGCGEEAKTKEYYSQHIEEAKARVAECKKLESMNETQQLDCTNANSAFFLYGNNTNNIYDTKNSPNQFIRKIPENPYK
ncbi:EexN family lipoprotein [Aliarcobacter butzleri]|uniref:EexN family lipoprotein n=1 Tax=Aliarcobacter butzleri TaxID=28197 RepID=A0AAW7Q189_9BACT|nr:EexN family lipoprotein [Aliarcobacter butzleri]MDN5071444.1 EexN family lipoprotein [Aliarcobacter butzleri]